MVSAAKAMDEADAWHEDETLCSEPWRNFLCGLLRGNDRVNLEVDNVTPIGDPCIKKVAISGFHKLKTPFKLFIHPA